jgi:glycosyltransferase involved in cell wall biosynthesis
MHDEAAAIIASSPDKKAKKLLWVHTDLRKIESWPMYFRTRKRQRRFFSKYNQIICVSEVARQSVGELLGLTQNVIVLHNPVDREKILKLAQEPCPLPAVDVPTVCAVGRLSWEKNFSMLIRAHKALVDRGVLHRLVIVGDGPERKKLENLIIELDAEKSVLLVGHQSNPYPYIGLSGFLAMSSVYEGYPTVVMEALVLRKPVVSSCAAAEEVFGGYPCGIITENNQEALENGLEKMLTDSVLYKRSLAGAVHRGNELGRQKEIKQIQMLLE